MCLQLWASLLFVLLSFCLLSPCLYAHFFPSLNPFRHFPRLWTIQYSCHWLFTFFFPRSVKRSRPLQYRMFANTGSTICIRWAYFALYSSVSNFSFISLHRLATGSPSSLPLGISSFLPWFISLWSFLLCEHCEKHGQDLQSVRLAWWISCSPLLRVGPNPIWCTER